MNLSGDNRLGSYDLQQKKLPFKEFFRVLSVRMQSANLLKLFKSKARSTLRDVWPFSQ